MARNQINQTTYDAIARQAPVKLKHAFNGIAAEMVGGKFNVITNEFNKRPHAAGRRPRTDAVRDLAARTAWIADGNTNE